MNNKILLSEEYIDELIINLTSIPGMYLASDASISEDEYFKGKIIGGESFLGAIDICCDKDGFISKYDFKFVSLELNKTNPRKFDEYEVLLKYAKLFYEQYKKYSLMSDEI